MEISRKVVYKTLLTMSATWLLVSMLVLVLVTLVVVVRAKSLKFVSIRVLKIKEVLGWECNFFSRLDKLVDSVSSRSDCTSDFIDRKACNIQKVMAKFHSIYEVIFWSESYYFATEYFMVRSRKEMWTTLEL